MDKVYENLKYLIDCDFEMIRFIDRTFNVDEKRAMKIMQFIMDNRKNNQCFQFEIKADLITSDFIEFIKKAPAGAFQFEIGVQSINPDVIVSLDRKESAEKLFNNIYQITSNGNIHTHLDLIIGLPGETLDSILAGIDKCFLLKPDTLQANTLKLLKGSPLWLKKNDNGLKCSPFAPYEVLESDCMSYDEIVYAEKVSKIINIFYNSGWFKITIQKICENMKFSEFVSKMVSKFDNECINFHSVSRKKLFEILYGFIRENIHSDLHEIVVEGLSVDFILTSKDYKKNFPEFEPVSNISSKKPKIQAEINITPKTMFKLSNSVNKILLKNDFTVESKKIIKDGENYCYYYFDFEKNSNCWIEDLNQVKILNELSQRKRDFKSLSEIVDCDDECFNNNMNFLREKNIISIL